MWIVTRRRYNTDLNAVKAEANRLRTERDNALKDAAMWHATSGRTAELFTDTSIVNDCLTRDLTKARRRVGIARRAAARLLAAWVTEKRRADLLQARLDDAVGLNDSRVTNGQHWQHNREDKREMRMKEAQP